jgi:hypothetical protein
MSERINKLYKPAELEAAIKLVQETEFENKTSEQVLIDWHAMGWRLVKVDDKRN